jgi:uncharacterized OB-fold protein
MSTAPDLVNRVTPDILVVSDEVPGGPGLRATRCRACGRWTLGRALACSHCFSRDVEPAAAGGNAELVEFSIARHPAGGFAAPYAIGLVRTQEGLTLFSPLKVDPDRIAVGDALHFTLVQHEDGRVGFAFADGREPQS